jgi:hypothetical protein
MPNPNRIGYLVDSPPNSGLGTSLLAGAPNINAGLAVANGIGTNWLALSSWADSNGNFIDPTGITDSWAALQSAIAYCAQQINEGTPIVLYVDCPVRVSIGVNAARTLFLGNGMTVKCMPGVGYFITDCIMLHLFDIINMIDVTFIDLDILYVGTFGVTAIDQQNQMTPNYGVIGTYNDTYGKGFMAAPNIGGIQQWAPVTFNGGGSSYGLPSATNACALINISAACDRISFLGKTKMRVPDGAPACNFIPFCISSHANWAPGSVMTSNPLPTNSNGGACPGHVYIEDALFDGYLMGICDEALHLQINNLRGVRYSDLQDANGNNIGGTCFDLMVLATAPLSGGTTITLQAPWAYKNQNTAITFSTGYTMSAAFAAGSATVTLSAYQNGSPTLPAATYSTTVAVQWSQNWFAPPHLIYLHSQDASGNFPCTFDIGRVFDEGVYVGSINTRNTGSGFIDSMKIEVANGSSINHYTSLRPHGGIDFMSFSNADGSFNKLYVQLNSAVYQQQTISFASALSSAVSATLALPWRYPSGSFSVTFSNGVTQSVALVFGQLTATWSTAVTATATASIVNSAQACAYVARFPSAPPIQGVSLNVEWVDTAPSPIGFPFFGDGQFGNTGVTIKSSGVVQDYPLAQTYVPGFSMGGQNINVDSTITFINCSSLKTQVGPAENSLAVQSFFKYTLIGWRATQLLFTGNSVSGSGGTLQTPFPYPAGSYEVSFSDGETRYVTFTANQTAITWSPALSASVSNVASISLMNGQNFQNMKPRIISSQGGLAYGNRLEVYDTTNSYTAICENNVMRETYVQDFQGTLSGATVALPIWLPPGYAIDSWAINVTGALTGTGVTGLNFGTAATPALINNGGGNTIAIGTAATNYFIPAHTPITYSGPVQLQLAAIGGTLTGGSVNLAVSIKGTTMAG